MKSLKFKGYIFDVDDTLLNNYPVVGGQGLHEKSRLEACRILGEEMDIPQLIGVTEKENSDAFRLAPIHSMDGAVWNLLVMKGLVNGDVIETEHDLLKSIVRLKNEVHEQVIREEAVETKGATAFVKVLVDRGYKDKLAVASSSIRRDIDIFFEKVGLDLYFSSERIISIECLEHTKPHPQAFNLAFDSLGLQEKDRTDVLVFEDDPRGIMSAVAAGLQVCAITTRYSREELEALEIAPHFVIDDFDEAYAIVELNN